MPDTASAPASAPASVPPKPTKKPASPVKNAYLIAYNTVSAWAWFVVLSRTVITASTQGPALVAADVADWTRWTQTLAAMEVLHALFGVVRAPVFTTLTQVLSRYLLVWGVVYPFPYLAVSPFYTSMLLAWSVTEVIRYSYFAVSLARAPASAPRPLVLLRYNTFFILYPVGILSECTLVYLAAEPLKEWDELLPYVSYAILAVYVPGSYILYTYMMKQRKKVMRMLREEDDSKAK